MRKLFTFVAAAALAAGPPRPAPAQSIYRCVGNGYETVVEALPDGSYRQYAGPNTYNHIAGTTYNIPCYQNTQFGNNPCRYCALFTLKVWDNTNGGWVLWQISPWRTLDITCQTSATSARFAHEFPLLPYGHTYLVEFYLCAQTQTNHDCDYAFAHNPISYDYQYFADQQ
jgi:hypothetical protein